jgi:hypothetical protein
MPVSSQLPWLKHGKRRMAPVFGSLRVTVVHSPVRPWLTTMFVSFMNGCPRRTEKASVFTIWNWTQNVTFETVRGTFAQRLMV